MPVQKWKPLNMDHIATAVLFVSGCMIGNVNARSLNDEDVSELAVWVTGGGPPVMVILVGIALLACGIFLIFGCLDICQRQTGFKDFDNEDVYTESAVRTSGPVGALGMIPPSENTPDPFNSQPIYFDPIPDVSQLRQKVNNATILRPKVGLYTPRNSEEFDEDDIPQRDALHDKLKLQSLLTNSRNQLPRSQLQYIKELGSGYFGKVLQGEGQRILPGHKKTKVVIQMLREDADPSEQLTFLQEAMPYRETDHPNVLKILGQCVETTPYLVVLELCPFGDLKTYLRSHRVAMESFNEKGLLLKFGCDMAAGLQALHQQNFVHHDFAARNCLLGSDLSVKIGDYGHGEEIFKEDYYFDANGDPVPIRWLAPETLSYSFDGSLSVRRITKNANVWSFGVSFWEVVNFGALPYSDLNNEHVLRLVVKEKSVKLPKPDLPLTNLDRLYQLMQICWTEQPAQRASLRELRIMLLHLLSQKGSSDSSAFDQKWNQLMPRKPAQVIKVSSENPPPAISNGSVQPIQPEPPLHPSGFDSDLVELNVSALAHKSDMSLHDELAQIHQPPPSAAVESPLNELSLEAELSAAFSPSRPEANELSLEQELNAAPSSGMESNQNQMSLEQELSQVKPPEESPIKEEYSTGENTYDTGDKALTESTITLTEGDISRNIPDIVATTTIKSNDPSPDFMTSTPKRSESDETKDSSNPDLMETATQGSTLFHTALTSQNSNASDQAEERSFLEQKKFAAMLQTVAALSFDGDDTDVMSSSFGSSLEQSTDDIFRDMDNATPTPAVSNYQKVPQEDSLRTGDTATLSVNNGAGDSGFNLLGE